MIKKIIIILVTLLVLGSGMYLIYEKTNKKQSDDNLANWMTYLLEADIQEISVTKSLSTLFGAEEDYYEKVTLTKAELKVIFNELSNYNLEKVYSGGIGCAGNDLTFTISYLVDDNLYKFQIVRGGYVLENKDDLELLQLFNANNYPTRGEHEINSYYFKYTADESFHSIFEGYLD